MGQYESVKTTDGLRIKWPRIAVQATPRLEMALQEFIEDGELIARKPYRASLRLAVYGWRHHPQYEISWQNSNQKALKDGVWWMPVAFLRVLAERMEESEWEDVTFAVESKQKKLAESGIDCDWP
jgi:hypothetical protein